LIGPDTGDLPAAWWDDEKERILMSVGPQHDLGAAIHLEGDLDASTLDYEEATRGFSPIPDADRNLPTAVARPYFKVSDDDIALEGAAFDHLGNLLFLDIYGGRVLRLSPDRKLEVVFTEKGLNPAGIAIHKDHRIFLAAVGPRDRRDHSSGSVIAIDPDGRNRTVIVPPEDGYAIDDMVFDSHGGFYFTDLRGTTTDPTGGVYYVTPDFSKITAVIPKMSRANGVALSPDGKLLWATE
jgi:lactonase